MAASLAPMGVPARDSALFTSTVPAASLAAAHVVDPPGAWDEANVDWSVGCTESQARGDEWVKEGATLLMRVPSVVVPVGWNYLLNPGHPDARKVRIRRIEHRPDPRLW